MLKCLKNYSHKVICMRIKGLFGIRGNERYKVSGIEICNIMQKTVCESWWVKASWWGPERGY